MSGKTKYPFTLVFLEAKGTMYGPLLYTAAKMRRAMHAIAERLRHGRRTMGPVPADPVPPRSADAYDSVDRNKSVRVA
jgi:hypothetical protein